MGVILQDEGCFFSYSTRKIVKYCTYTIGSIVEKCCLTCVQQSGQIAEYYEIVKLSILFN